VAAGVAEGVQRPRQVGDRAPRAPHPDGAFEGGDGGGQVAFGQVQLPENAERVGEVVAEVAGLAVGRRQLGGRPGAFVKRGPLAWGYVEDQCWTLGRVKTLIGRLFPIGYTIEGVGKLLHRHGWSVQVPARRAIERDEQAIALWKAEVWSAAKPPRRTWVPTSASKTKPGRD
jgi:hypothetical protein